MRFSHVIQLLWFLVVLGCPSVSGCPFPLLLGLSLRRRRPPLASLLPGRGRYKYQPWFHSLFSWSLEVVLRGRVFCIEILHGELDKRSVLWRVLKKFKWSFILDLNWRRLREDICWILLIFSLLQDELLWIIKKSLWWNFTWWLLLFAIAVLAEDILFLASLSSAILLSSHLYCGLNLCLSCSVFSVCLVIWS